MALHNIPLENRIESTDSNASTGLVENLFKKVKPISEYRLQDINAHTVKYSIGSIESSTTEFVNSDLLDRQARLIFADAKEEIFEDGMESDFSRGLSEFIVSYGHSAMETIIPIILSERTNSEVVASGKRVI
jgi:hypothetical protein